MSEAPVKRLYIITAKSRCCHFYQYRNRKGEVKEIKTRTYIKGQEPVMAIIWFAIKVHIAKLFHPKQTN